MTKALVVTVVHHPDDARIRHRQIAALLDAGWAVTYAAPFSGYDVGRRPHPGLTTVDLPRASGRRRLTALLAARTLLAGEANRHDVVLLHDPELLLAVRGLRIGPPVVWDVHEDTAAALSTKPWLPGPLLGPTRGLVRAAERAAERRHRLLLAEDAYQRRFRRLHPVVPNTALVPPWVTPPDHPRVVYVGHLTRARGVLEMIELGRLLAGTGIRVELIGHADAEATAALTAGTHLVDWRGFLPLGAAMARASGALAGLSLLHDEPNYRHSRPTKVVEYLAQGIPVITTPLPLARALVAESGGGLVVPFESPRRVAAAVLTLWEHPQQRLTMAASGHAYARRHLDWSVHAPAFVAALAEAAAA
jgi:glycosyltransferase involved in cell wall biosynthesis